ncbi:alpha-E domain-containing protein [Hymenobacter sp. HMF4947]|uniref:Alpha-E domain-containing protein n=1 Tax=Hymenobacter ginkgonis TaxID=2682976 RepID=A0A7K1TIP4_9BACT|nr:alpha-E domain-containing protein [Hymenobacter ginkgonis]MVN78243.1 alpha-E domain-containing protein [Hymenobacter ginkgonis]
MLSRVADTIYWLARYMERTQAMLQVIRIQYIASQDEPHYWGWQPLLNTYGDLSDKEIAKRAPHTPQVLYHLVFDRENAASAYRNIVQGRENARAVQDHISKEVWQSLNDYYHLIRHDAVAHQTLGEDPVSGLDALIQQGVLYVGTVQNTMPRDEGYIYLKLGKFLERALQTADLLRLNQHLFATENESVAGAPELRYLLYGLLGYELYIKTYQGHLEARSVLELVLYNADFPHSLIYSLGQLLRYCERLKDKSRPESYEHLRFLIGKARTTVAYSTLQDQKGEALEKFLAQVRSELLDITTALSSSFFGNG